MKRWTILLLILVFLVTAAGCAQKAPDTATPVTFYYPADKTVYDGLTSMLHPEIREGAGYEDDIAGLMNLYLKGPRLEELRSPFPRQITVHKYSSTSNTATLELSSEFAQLSGIDLTVACACIANTLFDLTQVDRVQIFANDAQLDGQTSITLERDDFLYADIPVATNDTAGTTTAP